MITNLYRDIAKASSAKATKNPLVQDPLQAFSDKPPDFTRLPEMMLEYENEHLATLSNIQWLLYPFAKTFNVLSKKLCRKTADKDYEADVARDKKRFKKFDKFN
jgi:hypothetical protein